MPGALVHKVRPGIGDPPGTVPIGGELAVVLALRDLGFRHDDPLATSVQLPDRKTGMP